MCVCAYVRVFVRVNVQALEETHNTAVVVVVVEVEVEVCTQGAVAAVSSCEGIFFLAFALGGS